MFEQIKKRIENNFATDLKEVSKSISTAKEFKNSYNGLDIKDRDGKTTRYLYQIGITELQAQKTLKEQKEIILKKYIKQSDKKKEKILKKLQTVEEVDIIPKRIDINVNWKKSATWGANPTAESWTNYGYFESSSIGGCGYDKESTATAEVFNQDKSILKLLYIEFEKYLKKNKTMLKHKGNINGREFCEYGCSCYYLPEFDGGVGFNSHRWILEKLGYKCIAESHPRMADTYHFERCKDAKK